MKPAILTVLLMLIVPPAIAQQQAPALSKNAMAIKSRVQRLTPDARISVVPFHDVEEFGKFVSSDEQGFTFYNVDLKTEVHLRYEDVRKVKDGYGGYNHLRGRHTDHSGILVGVLLVSGLMVSLIIALAVSK